ncbi:hypothetical protein GTW25_11515 [Aliihoeflea aestuarii]|jgi:hypothetical protein|uniref:hypothetical protein n=1 Tax=Aliihoeflea aestuarii TaxID=453840 RepID=UPI0020923274|nr:hypothetical protein [Aliihoeflea aestuarii]MCO6391659.1 hypothetical protein [Aliihoeflea aestuarii]
MLRKILIGIGAVAAAGIAFAIWRVPGQDSAMARPIITITTHIAQHTSTFFAENPQIDPQPHIRSEASGAYYSDVNLISFVAHAGRQNEPEGYALRYRKGDCDVSLPTGRAIALDYTAGFFKYLTSTLPLDPLSFDNVMELAQEIADSFDAAGWKRSRYNPEISQETFGERSVGGRFEILGQWVLCNEDPFYAAIKVQDFNSLPTAPMVPLVPGRSPSDDQPDRYLIEVQFGVKGLSLDNELTELRDARRLAVNGDKTTALTLNDWMDDPSWRPDGWQGKFVK